MEKKKQALETAKLAVTVALETVKITSLKKQNTPFANSAYMWKLEENEHAEAVATAELLVTGAEKALAILEKQEADNESRFMNNRPSFATIHTANEAEQKAKWERLRVDAEKAIEALETVGFKLK